MQLSFTVYGRFVPYVRMTQRGKWVRDDAQRYLASKHAIGLQLKQQMRDREMIPRQVPLLVDIHIEHDGGFHNCDLDNQVKAILDAAQDIVFEDDRWVDCILASRHQGDTNCITLEVTEL